jgi:hypothetical protein
LARDDLVERPALAGCGGVGERNRIPYDARGVSTSVANEREKIGTEFTDRLVAPTSAPELNEDFLRQIVTERSMAG